MGEEFPRKSRNVAKKHSKAADERRLTRIEKPDVLSAFIGVNPRPNKSFQEDARELVLAYLGWRASA